MATVHVRSLLTGGGGSAGGGGSTRGGKSFRRSNNDDEEELDPGGLNPALEQAVPKNQRPINQLAELKADTLYSW